MLAGYVEDCNGIAPGSDLEEGAVVYLTKLKILDNPHLTNPKY